MNKESSPFPRLCISRPRFFGFPPLAPPPHAPVPTKYNNKGKRMYQEEHNNTKHIDHFHCGW